MRNDSAGQRRSIDRSGEEQGAAEQCVTSYRGLEQIRGPVEDGHPPEGLSTSSHAAEAAEDKHAASSCGPAPIASPLTQSVCQKQNLWAVNAPSEAVPQQSQPQPHAGGLPHAAACNDCS